MHRSTLLCLATALATIQPAYPADELRQNIQRIFGGHALDGKTFGPARWIRNGASFTTVEPAAQDPGVREIIEYETASGKRSTLVTAAQLTPRDRKKPLVIEDYWWDRAMRRLLIFTD